MSDDDDRTAVKGAFDWGPPPRMTFFFHPEIHPENIQQIAKTMADAAGAKIEELDICSLGGCYGKSGNA